MDNRPIGIFDSGVGGLTVAKQVMKVLPKEQMIYFGDTAHLPYGSKSKEAVTKFSKQNVEFLLQKDVKAIIVACNTASANSLEELQATFDVPIFGVIDAGVAEALATTKNKKIGVIGTAGTVRAGAYEKMLCALDGEVSVKSKACPLFVPLAEACWTNNEIAHLTAKEYLTELLAFGIDSLVLGCTHYPLLKQCIGEVVGQDVILVDPAKATAQRVEVFLAEQNALHDDSSRAEHEFYLSDQTDMFTTICEIALEENHSPKIVDIDHWK